MSDVLFGSISMFLNNFHAQKFGLRVIVSTMSVTYWMTCWMSHGICWPDKGALLSWLLSKSAHWFQCVLAQNSSSQKRSHKAFWRLTLLSGWHRGRHKFSGVVVDYEEVDWVTDLSRPQLQANHLVFPYTNLWHHFIYIVMPHCVSSQ